MADPIQQQKDIFSKVQGLMAFLDTTDQQRNRENLEQWKQTYSKVTWGVLTTVLGLVTATIYKMIIEG